MTRGDDSSVVALHLTWVGSVPPSAAGLPRTKKERE
jgi:hypothetical protein